ncbi:MAG: hypothetical protein IJU21_07370 [Bacteroidales bacterium]|nr:hypothetical protein [Bacteroidales bacterium]
MKKVFMILGVSLMAALAVVSCSKPASNKDNKTEDEQKPDDKTPEDQEFSMEVAIDGDFSEWDTLTADSADGAYYIYEENGNANLDGLLRMKLTSDADNIYLYTELLYENIFIAEGGPYSLGWCNAGFGPYGFDGYVNVGTPGGLIVYVGCDGDDNGSYAARINDIDGESMWSYTGFDAFPQYYFCWDVAANKMQLGWQQNNAGEVAEDGDPLNDHGDGWIASTPDHDSDVSGEADVAFSGIVKLKNPATNKEADAIQMEIRMDREGFLKCYDIDKKAEGQAVIGIFYEQVGPEAKQTHATGSGKLPSSKTAATLKLK